jgi:hypothetical protein
MIKLLSPFRSPAAIPAKTGISGGVKRALLRRAIPASAGMTGADIVFNEEKAC